MFCPAVAKVPYATAGDARHVLRAINRRHGSSGMSVYRCRACGCFHLGRLNPRQERPRRPRREPAWESD